MSKNTLAAFRNFSATLLPHQIFWIEKTHQLADPEKIQIVEIISHNIRHTKKQISFPSEIDKRKYSYIKRWIPEKLKSIDVDAFYQWLSEIDKKIMTDSLTLEDEKDIIHYIKSYRHPTYYFLRFYELMQNYRHFLLIRVRHENYTVIGHFLEDYAKQYRKGQMVYQQLHEATTDIVSHYKYAGLESRKWEETLVNIFEDETLDGLNRYFAIVRLTFLLYVYKEYDRLIALYDKLDNLFEKGYMYSPRILVNYYANRLLVHARGKDLEKACYYGYLSIRHKSNDYLQYLNNLSAVLMRCGKHQEALKLLTGAFADFKKTLSSHNRIGFASFYIQALIRNKLPSEAVSYARSFLENYREDILRNRWHVFFTAYLFALLETEQYAKILSLTKKHDLLTREASYRKKPGYIPSFICVYELARYKELQISAKQLNESLYESILPHIPDQHKFRLMSEMCTELKHHAPETFQKLYDKLFRNPTYKVTPNFMA